MNAIIFDFKSDNGPVPAHQHPNGGGWVADTAHVDATAYVGPNAHVYGYARVSGDAQIRNYARVYGYAQVSDYARVGGTAQVSGESHVYGYAQIFSNAWVSGYAQVYGNARISGNTRVKRGEYESTPITITRSDGYHFTLQSDGSVLAGCRDFYPFEADKYWGNPKHHKHAESMAILTALRAIHAARQ